jgi:hypothetical protein
LVINGPATIGSGHALTVQDGAVAFVNGSLVNQGAITVHHDGSLLIAENSVNAGTIQAVRSGAAVTIQNATITNSITDSQGHIVDGKIDIGNGAHLFLNNGSILQGIVQVDAGGEIDTVSGTANTINTANGPTHNTTTPSITNNGIVNIADNSSLALATPFNIENNGRIELASTGHKAILYFNQPFPILAGNGTIFLKGGPGAQDIIAGLAGDGFSTVNLDNQGNTIAGAGQIGQNDGALTFTSDIGSNGAIGTINADLTGQTLTVETGALFTNNALMESTNGGILDVVDSVHNRGTIEADFFSTAVLQNQVQNTHGLIAAGLTGPVPPVPSDEGELNSFVNLDNATIIGGTLETGFSPPIPVFPGVNANFSRPSASSGVIETVTNPDGSASTSVLDGVTSDAFVLVNEFTTLVLRGTIANTGEILVHEGANLAIDGSVVLTGDGTGVILLSASTLTSLTGVPGTDAVLENVNNVIFGTGQISGLTLINDGGIDASGGLLTIDADNTLTNTGALVADNFGELDVHTTVDNSGGDVAAFGGFVDFFLGISGGSAEMAGGKLEYGWSSNVETNFVGAGTLILDHQARSDPNFAVASFTGAIGDFHIDDAIVLSDLAFAATERAVWNQAAGVLSIFEGATLEATLNFSGSYVSSNFKLESFNGETEVVYQVSPIDEWIGPSSENRSGTWITGSNWTLGVPNSTLDTVIDLPGTYTVTTSGEQAARTLTVTDQDATVTGSGTLTVEVLENHGTIKATGDQDLVINETGTGTTNFGKFLALDGGTPTVNHAGSAILEAGGVARSDGWGSTLILNNNESVANYGSVVAADHGTVVVDVVVDELAVDDVPGGNFNVMKAVSDGTLSIIGDMFNAADATIKADGFCSIVDFSAADYAANTPTGIDNQGDILATHHGIVRIADVGIDNSGTIGARHHGTVEIAFSLIDNSGGTISARGRGSSVELFNVAIFGGTLLTGDLTNGKHGVIDIVAPGEDAINIVDFDGSLHGALTVDAFVRVEAHATLELIGAINNNGAIAAHGWDAHIDLIGTTVTGGALDASCGALIQTVRDSGASELDGVSVIDDSHVRVSHGTKLTLADGSTMFGGKLLIDCGGEVHVGSITGATLDGVDAINHGSIKIDPAASSDGASSFSFTTLNDPSVTTFSFNSVPDFAATNNAGEVVGEEHSQPFLYKDGAYTDLNQPNADHSIATIGYNNGVTAINDSGQVGFYTDASGFEHGFIYSNGAYANLDDPNADLNAISSIQGTFPQSINSAGEVAGYYVDSETGSVRGFIYDNGNYTTLNDPSAGQGAHQGTFAETITDSGIVIGYYVDRNNQSHGFIYNNGAYITLDDPSAVGGTHVSGGNNVGEIFGYSNGFGTPDQGFIFKDGAYTTLQASDSAYRPFRWRSMTPARSLVITWMPTAISMASCTRTVRTSLSTRLAPSALSSRR